MVGPWGDVQADAGAGPGTVVHTLDLLRVDEVRTNVPVGHQRRHDLYALTETAAK